MELSYSLEPKKISNDCHENVLSKLMKQTDTVIYCPSNETNPTTIRIPKLTVSGSLGAVESARLFIRVLAIFLFKTSSYSLQLFIT